MNDVLVLVIKRVHLR